MIISNIIIIIIIIITITTTPPSFTRDLLKDWNFCRVHRKFLPLPKKKIIGFELSVKYKSITNERKPLSYRPSQTNVGEKRKIKKIVSALQEAGWTSPLNNPFNSRPHSRCDFSEIRVNTVMALERDEKGAQGPDSNDTHRQGRREGEKRTRESRKMN